VQLEREAKGFGERGLNVAAVLRERPELLKAFARRHGVHYPLLADVDAAVVKRFGLANPAYQGQPLYGTPYAGTLVLDAGRVVRERYFEAENPYRQTPGSIRVRGGGVAAPEDAARMPLDHFTLRAFASDAEAAPGNIVTLGLQIEMVPGRHAYAPGAAGYRPLQLSMDPHPLVRFHEPRLPPSEPYYFAPLKETVPVFKGTFRVLQDATVSASVGVIKPMPERFDLAGTLSYQVCSETVCYPPATQRVTWTLRVRPLPPKDPPPVR
jgi:hypothetical protein